MEGRVGWEAGSPYAISSHSSFPWGSGPARRQHSLAPQVGAALPFPGDLSLSLHAFVLSASQARVWWERPRTEWTVVRKADGQGEMAEMAGGQHCQGCCAQWANGRGVGASASAELMEVASGPLKRTSTQ